MNAQIYLLDEPSSNLDMTSIQELAEHLRLIKRQGKTILIAEHRLYYLMDWLTGSFIWKMDGSKECILRMNSAGCQIRSVCAWGYGQWI